jgi:hypothetical protein
LDGQRPADECLCAGRLPADIDDTAIIELGDAGNLPVKPLHGVEEASPHMMSGKKAGPRLTPNSQRRPGFAPGLCIYPQSRNTARCGAV